MALAYFKYFNFGIDSLNALWATRGRAGLPHGMSFCPSVFHSTFFQAVSYLIDIYRKDAHPADKFIDFMAFSSLFPQLIAGPVIRYKDLKTSSAAAPIRGKIQRRAIRFAMGFCKNLYCRYIGANCRCCLCLEKSNPRRLMARYPCLHGAALF